MHAWLELVPWDISLPFKTMKNTKSAHPVLNINSFYD